MNKTSKSENNGYQLLLRLPDHSQFALELTVLTEPTALELYATVPTDQKMDQLEPHAQEKNQLPSHITTPNQLLDRDIKTLETLPQLTHLLLTHQLQSQLLFSKLIQKVPTKKQLPKLERTSTTRDTHNQKKFSFLIQRLPEHTPPSMLNNTER